MPTNWRIGFIGGGAMGSAIVRGLLENGTCTPDQIAVSEPADAQRTWLAAEFGVATTADNRAAVQNRDIVVLCVKPQIFPLAGPELAGILDHRTLLVSIMAGISLAGLAAHTGQHPQIVRAMPNTPAQVLAGMTVWTATAAVSAADRQVAATLFEAIGSQHYTPDEGDLDKATAINGSGPGYLFLLLEAMIDAGVHIGFDRTVAARLAIETFRGSAALMHAHPEQHPAVLRNLVTSPAGTTAAGLQVLERAGLRAAMTDAVAAAYARSRELGT